MSRGCLLLPLLTTALPVIAGIVPVLHGALAGLVAIAGPLVVDVVLGVRNGARWQAGASEPPLPSRYYAVLFGLYASGYAFFFARFVLTSAALPMADVVGCGFSWVVLSGVPTLIVGHALIRARARVAGQVLFSLLGYPDFPRLHVEVHHRYVATDADHHSASANETFYGFFARSLHGELTSVPKVGQRGKAALLLALQVGLVVVVGLLPGGPPCAGGARGHDVPVAWRRRAGELRSALRARAREKVGVQHAWDLPFKSGNWLYFNAGFHADHHLKASTDPGALVYRSTRFILPYNVSIILPLALVSPVFFRVMNPILARSGHDRVTFTRCCPARCAPPRDA